MPPSTHDASTYTSELRTTFRDFATLIPADPPDTPCLSLSARIYMTAVTSSFGVIKYDCPSQRPMWPISRTSSYAKDVDTGHRWPRKGCRLTKTCIHHRARVCGTHIRSLDALIQACSLGDSNGPGFYSGKPCKCLGTRRLSKKKLESGRTASAGRDRKKSVRNSTQSGLGLSRVRPDRHFAQGFMPLEDTDTRR